MLCGYNQNRTWSQFLCCVRSPADKNSDIQQKKASSLKEKFPVFLWIGESIGQHKTALAVTLIVLGLLLLPVIGGVIPLTLIPALASSITISVGIGIGSAACGAGFGLLVQDLWACLSKVSHKESDSPTVVAPNNTSKFKKTRSDGDDPYQFLGPSRQSRIFSEEPISPRTKQEQLVPDELLAVKTTLDGLNQQVRQLVGQANQQKDVNKQVKRQAKQQAEQLKTLQSGVQRVYQRIAETTTPVQLEHQLPNFSDPSVSSVNPTQHFSKNPTLSLYSSRGKSRPARAPQAAPHKQALDPGYSQNILSSSSSLSLNSTSSPTLVTSPIPNTSLYSGSSPMSIAQPLLQASSTSSGLSSITSPSSSSSSTSSSSSGSSSGSSSTSSLSPNSILDSGSSPLLTSSSSSKEEAVDKEKEAEETQVVNEAVIPNPS